MDLQQQLKALRERGEATLKTARSVEQLEALRLEFLGRKGELSQLLRGLKDLPAEQKTAVGASANQLKEEISTVIDEKIKALQAAALDEQLAHGQLDVTMPGPFVPYCPPHPLSRVMQELCDVFQALGFSVIDESLCPEVETEYYNFEALNFPPDHPARDMQDTFYTDVAPNVLLRSQTSNAQIRYLENHRPPVRVVAPGRVYRNETVSSRKNVLFHQVEGLLVDKDVSFAQLKGTLHAFIAAFFGGERPTRFRASYFPFTEPSAEMDVQCLFCSGNGCKVCSGLGWLEILGAGMVHPNVLKAVGIDPDVTSGFAFGMGVERLAMLKYGIDDIRAFYTNDLRFLRQLKG